MNTNKYIHVNIFKIYTACVCIYIYMITKHIYEYKHSTIHVYYVNNNFYFGCDLSFDITKKNNPVLDNINMFWFVIRQICDHSLYLWIPIFLSIQFAE